MLRIEIVTFASSTLVKNGIFQLILTIINQAWTVQKYCNKSIP